VVVVSGGRNDLAVAGDQSCAQSVATFYADLRSAFPDAEILAVSTLWDDEPAPDDLAVIADAVRAGVERVGGAYLDVGQPLAGRPDLLGRDGVHPNDEGHRAIADAINSAIAGAGITR
jgi:acyl-CoA thioesterase-1